MKRAKPSVYRKPLDHEAWRKAWDKWEPPLRIMMPESIFRAGWDAGYKHAYSEIECVMKKPKKKRAR